MSRLPREPPSAFLGPTLGIFESFKELSSFTEVSAEPLQTPAGISPRCWVQQNAPAYLILERCLPGLFCAVQTALLPGVPALVLVCLRMQSG
jgi:hypothetical protein